MVNVSNALLERYLEAWMDNGNSESDDPEEILAEAMSEDNSLIEWGIKESRYAEFEYDYEFGLSIIRKY